MCSCPLEFVTLPLSTSGTLLLLNTPVRCRPGRAPSPAVQWRVAGESTRRCRRDEAAEGEAAVTGVVR
jgi:hypothetical protein